MSLSADLQGRRPTATRPVSDARSAGSRSRRGAGRLGVAAVRPDWELVVLNGDRLQTPTIVRREPAGTIAAVTYRAELRPSVRELWRHLVDPDAALVARRRLTGGVPVSEFEAGGLAEAAWSMDSAVAAAAGQLGMPVTEHGCGALVEAVRDDTDSVRVGDVVCAVDGVAVDTATGLRQALAGHPRVRITVRGAVPAEPMREVVLRRHADGAWGLRVVTAERTLRHPVIAGFTLPDDLAGPSLGLACALSVIDALGSADLAVDGDVAATGTVDLAGRVGQVGAMVFKARAVRADPRVRRFLIPAENPADVDAARQILAGHCAVLPVATLDGAVSALRARR